jgi:outer membrane protein assembly factor BamB
VTAIDIAHGRVRWTFVVPDVELHQVALSRDGGTIAVDSGDTSNGLVTVYNATNGKRRQSVSQQSYGSVSCLHHGAWLVITTGGVA